MTNPPATFYGTSNPGDTVVAVIRGIECGSAITDASGFWMMRIAEGGQSGARDGDVVSFRVNGMPVGHREVWRAGAAPRDVANGVPINISPVGAPLEDRATYWQQTTLNLRQEATNEIDLTIEELKGFADTIEDLPGDDEDDAFVREFIRRAIIPHLEATIRELRRISELQSAEAFVQSAGKLEEGDAERGRFSETLKGAGRSGGRAVDILYRATQAVSLILKAWQAAQQ